VEIGQQSVKLEHIGQGGLEQQLTSCPVPDILHQLTIEAPVADVFRAVSEPEGINAWWTKRCNGAPVEGSVYELFFAPGYDWRAKVTKCVPNTSFELTLTQADEDWTGLRVGFELSEKDETVQVQFYNLGWAKENDHFRISNTCWAMYLRLLKRYVVHGEVVEYDQRLAV
jgi:uncharacterized protein YndB with AHSA1/START domain